MGLGTRAFRYAFVVALTLAGCATQPPESQPPPPQFSELNLAPIGFGDLAGWRADRQAAALPAMRRSCAKLAAEPDEMQAGPAGTHLTARDWRPACAALSTIGSADDGAARAYFERWFQPYRASDRGATAGSFTGYFEIGLRGARHPGGRYNVPIYGVPRDLATVDGKQVVRTTLEPYPTRAEIEAGVLAGKAPVLVWVDDPIDAFFLSVQGSGRVTLEDGKILALGYGATNGRPYRSIGKILVERGALALEDVSLQSISAWLRAHPGEAKALMDQDAHYVFFRLLGAEGPIGSEGVALTPGRSLAVDPGFISLGVPIWLDAEGAAGLAPIRRLVVAQDTGSAIKGPVRGDLFWGYGPEAEAAAGHMRAHGTYDLLLPRAARP